MEIMADNYDVGSLVASIQLDVSNLQRDISSATSAFSNLGGKIDSMATSVTRSEGYLKNMSSQMGNMRDDMLQYTIAIESAIRALPAAFQQAGTGSAAGMRIMQESMEAAKATSYTLNTVIAAQLEALTAKVNAQTSIMASSFEKLGKSMSSSLEAGFAKVTGGTSLSGIASKLSSAETGMKGIQRETRNTASAMDLLADRIKNANSSFTSFTSGAMGKIRGLTTDLFFLQMMTQQIGSAFEFAFGQGIKFSIEMENALMGIGGIIASSMTMDGKDIQFDQGMALASKAAERLRVAALTTTVSMSELMGVFQAIVGPASALGMSFDEIIDFSVFGSTAVKALGLRKDQLVQELRSIVTGNITARSSTLATALGITNEDIENAKSQVGGVFAFLQQRMAGFAELSKQQGASFEAIWTNIQDGIQQTQERAFTGLFTRLKAELAEVQGLFFQTTTDETGKEVVKLNPETVARFEQIAAATEVIYDDIKNWVIALSENDAFLANVERYTSAIAGFAEYIYANFMSIVSQLAIVYAFSGGWLRLISMLIIYFDAVPETLQFIEDHIDIVIGLMALWVGAMSPLTSGLLLVLQYNEEIRFVLGLLFSGVTKVVGAIWTMEAATATTTATFGGLEAMASYTFATIVAGAVAAALAIGGVIAGIYAMKLAMDQAYAETTAEERGGLAAEAGTGDLGEETAMLPSQIPGAEEAKPKEETVADKIARKQAEYEAKIAENERKMQEKLAAIQNGQLAQKYPSTEKAPKGRGGGAGDATRAEMAEIEGALKLANDAIKYQLDELKYNYQEHTISIQEYFTQAADLTKQMTQNEIDALNEKLAVATKESQRAKIQQEIELKTQQLGRDSIKILREKTKAYKELDKALKDFEASAAERSGDLEKAALIKFDASNEDNLKKFNVEIAAYEARLSELSATEQQWLSRLKESVKTINDQRETTKNQAAFTEQQNKQKNYELILAAKKQEADKKLKEGAISEIEYKQLIIDANNNLSTSLETLIPQMEALAAAEQDVSKKRDMINAITTLKSRIVELREPLSAVASQVKSDFVDATSSAFEGLIMQTKTVSEAFQDMAKSILASLAKIVAQRAATSIANNLFSSFLGGTKAATAGISSGYYTGTLGSTGSWSTAFSHANGGQITGPGTGTSDSIPTMLSNGEFVIRAASVSKIGKNALEYINNFGSLPKLHYAEGGMVGNAGTSAGLSTIKINVINQTGTPVQAKTDTPTFNGVEQVMNLWLTGVNSNVLQSRDVLKSMAKG